MHGVEGRATLTREGVLHGAGLSAPLFPGVVVFAAAFGTVAAQKGLTIWEAMAMSGLVFAGASQLVALELWTQHWTPWAILAITGVTAAVNLRFLLMSASMRPWLAELPSPAWRYGMLATLTDANWLIAMSYRAEGGRDLGVFLGAGLSLMVIWTLSTAPGWLLGALIPDPSRYGLDLVLPIFFALMIVPLWKEGRDALAWTVTGIVSVGAYLLLGGYWFIVLGAIAGAVAAAFDGDD